MTQIEVQLGRHEERLNDLEKVTGRIESKLDRFQAWLLTVAGGVIASLLLLIVNLFVMGGK